MAKFVLKDAKVLYGGRDLSGELSSVDLVYTATTPENTTFGNNSVRRLPGIMDAVATQNGYWDAVSATDSLDADLFAQIAAASDVVTLSPDGGQAAEIAFLFKGQAASYNPGASHGEVFAFALTINGDGELSRGLVLENGVFTATANGTEQQVGAVLAGENIYSNIHVVAASGTTPTLDVTVQSDIVGFGSPTLQMTHPQFTAVGANQQILAGAVTDDYWRYVITIGGGSPSFTIFGSLAVK